MAIAYNFIASSTVGVLGSATVSFTSIPATYTDLLVKLSARGSGVNSNEIRLTFNSNTSSYSNKTLYGFICCSVCIIHKIHCIKRFIRS